MLKISVLASHQGTNFQAIYDACESGKVHAQIALLICNNSTAPVFERAKRAGITSVHASSKTHDSDASLDDAICEALINAGTDLVVLAGYMKKLGPRVLATYAGRMINVHPSLLPKYGGQGYYGSKVHEAVIAAGDMETGATVHLVTSDYDEGTILAQEVVRVREGESAGELANRIRPVEHALLLEVIQTYIEEPSRWRKTN